MTLENANPTVHKVRLRRNISIQSRRLTSPYTTSSPYDNDQNGPENITPEERSARTALSSIPPHQTDLLRRVGFHFDDNTTSTNDDDEDEDDDDKGKKLRHSKKITTTSITNSLLLSRSSSTSRSSRPIETNGKREPIDAEEVFDMIRDICDPEHPLSLEQLNVVCIDHIDVIDGDCNDERTTTDDRSFSSVDVRFTPTIPHCSMATLIGLSIRVKLLRSLPSRFKICVTINPGTHASEVAVNRQLNDKERVAAALENQSLLGVVNKCLAGMEAVA